MIKLYIIYIYYNNEYNIKRHTPTYRYAHVRMAKPTHT